MNLITAGVLCAGVFIIAAVFLFGYSFVPGGEGAAGWCLVVMFFAGIAGAGVAVAIVQQLPKGTP